MKGERIIWTSRMENRGEGLLYCYEFNGMKSVLVAFVARYQSALVKTFFIT